MLKPQRYAACRSAKENQTISTITNDRDEQRHIASNALVHSNIYDGDRLTQVKTYTDHGPHGNGYGQRSGGTTHYSKVRPYHLINMSLAYELKVTLRLYSISYFCVFDTAVTGT